MEDDFYGMIKVDDKGYASRWMLSEDKNDRKDGLWIWGLFEEPKYPYLYFSLFVFKSIILASGLEEPIFGGDGVPGDRLNFRFSHFRNDPAKGAELTAGEMSYDIAETVQADPFGPGRRSAHGIRAVPPPQTGHAAPRVQQWTAGRATCALQRFAAVP